MSIYKNPDTFGTANNISGDNTIVAIVGAKAIIRTDDGELHYIEGWDPAYGDIGEVVPDGSFKSVRLLTAAEQIEIREALGSTLYLSGAHALNLPCSLETCGDWHRSALQWERLRLLNSSDSIWGDYGIETGKAVPERTQLFNVANHIRALLDLLEQGNFIAAQGMREDFICNEIYTDEIFDKVSLLRHKDHWPDIDSFMSKEYSDDWLSFKTRAAL
jgi:hypothetical protein